MSSTVIVWTESPVLSQLSLAVNVRVMVHVLGQAPSVVSTATVMVAAERLSLAAAAS